MSTITAVRARQIFDSRGNPTVEVELTTEKGVFTAAVPSGASTGAHEALELRDGGAAYMGKGVSKAIQNVNEIIGPKVIGRSVLDQAALDKFMYEELDGSSLEGVGWTKAKLGANAILAVSMAACRAGAAAANLPLYAHIANLANKPAPSQYTLPIPFMNVINGGEHAGNGLAMQEFMIAPLGAKSFTEAMQMGTEVYHNLKSVIKKKYGQDAANVGDEGGFAPNVTDAVEALDLLQLAIEKAGYTGRMYIAMDAAASEFALDGGEKGYDLLKKDPKNNGSGVRSGAQLAQLYLDFCAKYPIVSIEDPFAEDDWASFTKLTGEVPKNVQIVADDLCVTNPVRVQKAIDQKAATALLLKVNQIGTVTESIEAAALAEKAGWSVMVSHRSGETEDAFIADLAVGIGAKQIKAGAPCRSERLVKYNQLLRIEGDLAEKARYPGEDFRGFF